MARPAIFRPAPPGSSSACARRDVVANWRVRRNLLRLLSILLAALAAWVLWDRMAHSRPTGVAAPAQSAATTQTPPTAPVPAVPIADRKTIDFSSGQPVVKDDLENKQAIDAALPDMQDALRDVSFDPKPPAPPSPKTGGKP